MSDEIPTETGRPIRQNLPGGTCPRCGDDVPPSTRGRPRIWCSQACRRAAYEERRAATAGAIAVALVDRVEVREHPISKCVDHTIMSTTGCRRVVLELARLTREGTLQSDPRWGSTYVAVKGLFDALHHNSSARYR